MASLFAPLSAWNWAWYVKVETSLDTSVVGARMVGVTNVRASYRVLQGVTMQLMTYLLLTIALTLNAAANIFIKAAMRSSAGSSLPLVLRDSVSNPLLWCGVACFAFALAFYSAVLSRMPLSLAYPIMTTGGFALVLLVSTLWFGERLSGLQSVGLLLILTGVWLASSNS